MAFASLRARRGRSTLTLVALVIALSFLTVMGALTRGFTAALERNARASYLAGQVTILPGVSTLNRNVPGAKYFEIDDPRKGLDEGTVERLRARPDVVRVTPQVPFPYPVTARATVEDRAFEIDLPLFAVDAALIARDRRPEIVLREGELGVVVSRRLLDIYNIGLVPTASTTLPKLSEQGLVGFRFEGEVGYSSFLQSRPLGRTVTLPLRVVGFTDQPTLIGATITLEEGQELLERIAPGQVFPSTYRTVLVFAKDSTAADRLASELKDQGYRASTLSTTLAGVSSSAAAVSTVLGLLVALVLVLAILTVATTMLTATLERTSEIGLLRALGARKRDILVRFLTEAALLGLIAGLLGMGLGLLAARGAELLLLRLLPDTNLFEAGVVAYDWVTLLLPVAGGIVVALIGAVIPAARASSIPPVQALRSA